MARDLRQYTRYKMMQISRARNWRWSSAGDNKCLKAVNLMFKSFATVIANAALNFGAGSGIVIAGELRQGYVACSIKVDFMSG